MPEEDPESYVPPEVIEHPVNEAPVRELEPVKFFGPHGDPVASRDFRPTSIAFKDDDEDHPEEDGHGNFKRPTTPALIHPSQPREPYPYENQTARPATEEQEAPEEGESKQDSPFGP